MRKRRALKARKTHRAHHVSRGTKKLIYGMDPDFILILGGGFLIVVLGTMILRG